MSWTEIYPIMTEDLVEEFEELATADERAELEEWFGVREVFNEQRSKKHLISVSMFWKPSQASKKPYPEPTREILMNPSEFDLDLRFEPWPHYIEPILETVPKLLKTYDDVAVRVYLAADLDFLVTDFVEAGCEVFLMRHPSIAHAPGVAWRVLAFSEKDRLVTMMDADRIREAAADIERTRAMERDGLGVWRVPVALDTDVSGKVCYKPFIGCQMGAVGGWPMERLIHAFTWHTLRGGLPPMVELPGCGLRQFNLGKWPDYGYEEWFLAVAMYPRMAGAGMLTFAPATVKSVFLLLDIEYVTWANPASQLVFFPVAGCCSPAAGAKLKENELAAAFEAHARSSQNRLEAVEA